MFFFPISAACTNRIPIVTALLQAGMLDRDADLVLNPVYLA